MSPTQLGGQVRTLTGVQRIGIGGGIIAMLLGGLYQREGGYVDNPADRGGATRYGVTQSVARTFGYTGRMQDFPKNCDAEHPVCADLVYTTNYIAKPGYAPFTTLEPAVLFELVDSAVLHGPARSSTWLQQSLNEVCLSGLKVDGQVGKQTIDAYRICQGNYGKVNLCIRMLDSLDGRQEKFFNAIVVRDPSQRVFLKGWLAQRIGNVPRTDCRP